VTLSWAKSASRPKCHSPTAIGGRRRVTRTDGRRGARARTVRLGRSLCASVCLDLAGHAVEVPVVMATVRVSSFALAGSPPDPTTTYRHETGSSTALQGSGVRRRHQGVLIRGRSGRCR
jgi:hypothetical protein